MVKQLGIILLALFVVGSIKLVPAREVTLEDIRDGMLSLVHSYNVLDNKLERHEHRERALGELIKRALQGLQKGQKVFEPMNGIFSRLDERVGQIETMLMSQEERHNTQTEKLGEALEQIFKYMQENNECFNNHMKKQESVAFKIPPPVPVAPVDTKLSDNVNQLSKDVQELVKSSKDILKEAGNLINTEKGNADDVLAKIDDKFTSFYITGTTTTTPKPLIKPSLFETNVIEFMDKINNNLVALTETKPAKVSDDKFSEADRAYLNDISNETIASIEQIKMEIVSLSNKAFDKTNMEILETRNSVNKPLSDIINKFSQQSEIAEKFYSEMNNSLAVLSDGFDIFNKFNKILLANSDYVLETQRKVEFGTHQSIQKIGEMIRNENTGLNEAIQKRFDDIDNSIVNNHLEALKNLSSTMESEISHVWRQIEIMHSELTDSKDALNKLQGQTETYVNGTINTMDGMGNKVTQITSKMAEVDSNLNYLLGRLLLVTQEFNKIKTGLGSALDQIRSSFQTVQDKIGNPGPGPHAILEHEYETDINLLAKRNAA